MQAGFISIALGVKVVEGSVLQVDPLCVVAPRAKAVVVREHMRRKGAAAIFGNRDPTTGHLNSGLNKDKAGEDALIQAARDRASALEAELAQTEATLREEQRQILKERAAAAEAKKRR